MISWIVLIVCIPIISPSYYYSNQSLSLGKQITHLQLSSRNQLLFISTQQTNSHKSNLHIYNRTYQSNYFEIEVLSVDLGIINVMILSRQRNILLLGLRNNNIQLYQVTSNKMPQLVYSIDGWSLETGQIDFSLDSNYIVMGNANHTISCYQRVAEANTSKLSFKLIDTIATNQIQISCLKISPNSSRLYVSYLNHTLCIYNLVDSTYVFDMFIKYGEDIVTEIHLSELGRVMTVGTKKGRVIAYVPDSKGKGLYETQALHDSQSQIISIQVSINSGLIMLVTDSDRVVYQYSRISKSYNWIYDQDKSDRFIASYSANRSTLEGVDSESIWSTPPPLLASDDTFAIYPSSQTGVTFMVSCNSTLKNCNKCLNGSICQSCNEYYYFTNPMLMNNIQINPCLPCSRGCINCKNPERCLSCDTSSHLDSIAGVCISCNREIVNCKKCGGKNRCIECADGYQLSNNACWMVDAGNESPNKIFDLRGENSTVSRESGRAQEGEEVLYLFIIFCAIVVFLLMIVMTALYCVLKIIRQRDRAMEFRSIGAQSERTLNRAE